MEEIEAFKPLLSSLAELQITTTSPVLQNVHIPFCQISTLYEQTEGRGTARTVFPRVPIEVVVTSFSQDGEIQTQIPFVK